MNKIKDKNFIPSPPKKEITLEEFMMIRKAIIYHRELEEKTFDEIINILINKDPLFWNELVRMYFRYKQSVKDIHHL